MASGDFRELSPIHPWQTNIGYHQIEGTIRLQEVSRSLRLCRFKRAIAKFLKHIPHQQSHGIIVFHEQDKLAFAFSNFFCWLGFFQRKRG